MNRPPAFWSSASGGLPALALAPASWLVSAASARRARRAGYAAGIPVFCCGNATVGGTGKTILALDLLRRLSRRGLDPHAILRGHGGRPGRRAMLVDPDRDAPDLTGDEALLLARAAPCWVARDRALAARHAAGAGAGALVMDDGLQNFGLRKDCSFLVVDGEQGFGNGLVLPAGPLREPPLQALERCRAMVLIGHDRFGIMARFRGHRPILRASLRQGREVEALRGRPVVAFAGIGRPGKFFDGLKRAGIDRIRTVAFPDHHRYDGADLARLLAIRDRAGPDAALATTAKDAVRLPASFRARVVVVGVALDWADGRIERVIDAALDCR